MLEREIKDSFVGSRNYIKELALELVEAWKLEDYNYVLDTLAEAPYILSVAVYHFLPYQSDRDYFLVRSINHCKPQWAVFESQ